MPTEVLQAAEDRSVKAAIEGITQLQSCQLWKHRPELKGAELTKEQV